MKNAKPATEASASRGGLTAATLAFSGGASELQIRPEPAPECLFTARFTGRQPAVSTTGATVRVRYRLGPKPHSGEITLNPEVSWSIRVDGGVSGLHADLTGIPVVSIDVNGGASRVMLRLPSVAADRVPIRISGGASLVTILRPGGIPARLHVSRGAAQLAFDDQRFDAIGGDLQLTSPEELLGTGHYDIDIGSGARGLTVRTNDGQED